MIQIKTKNKGSQVLNFFNNAKSDYLKLTIVLIAVLYFCYCAIYHVYSIIQNNISKIPSFLHFLNLVLKLVFVGGKEQGRQFFNQYVMPSNNG